MTLTGRFCVGYNGFRRPRRTGEPVPADRPIAIETRNLSRRFGRVVAVDSLTLRVREGEIFGFLGPNGAGKTTTIRMLSGVLAPSEGSGTVAGFDIARHPEAIKRRVGYMAQRFSLYGDLTTRENLDFFGGIYRLRAQERRQRVGEALERTGLIPYADQLAEALSGGLRQRLALACAIVHRPRILLLDEPTAGVDPGSRQVVWDLLYGIGREGTTIFVTTHYIEEAERCRSVGFMHHGRLLAYGTPEQCKQGMAEDLLELTAEPPARALDAVRGLDGVVGAAFYGNAIRVFVRSAAEMADVLQVRLAEAGIAVQDLRRVRPTLEDVFLSLTRE
jgi:ABC-2 type transport system ATP-binding protein